MSRQKLSNNGFDHVARDWAATPNFRTHFVPLPAGATPRLPELQNARAVWQPRLSGDRGQKQSSKNQCGLSLVVITGFVCVCCFVL